MRECANCGKRIEGRATKKYCGDTCKTGAYRSRKLTAKEEGKSTLSKGQKHDLNHVGNYSPDAMQRLLKVKALCGRRAFDLALDACYIAVVDITSS